MARRSNRKRIGVSAEQITDFTGMAAQSGRSASRQSRWKQSLVDIAVVPEGEGAGLSARIVDHAAARPPRSRARSRRIAPVPGEHENGRRASSRARLVLRAIERQDVEGIRLDFVIVLARVQDIEIGNTVNPKDDSFAINELICSTPRATRRVFQTSQT